MKAFKISLLAAILAGAPAMAELDGTQAPQLPAGLVVRVSEAGVREVFKTDLVVTSDKEAVEATKSVKPENKLAVVDSSELDNTTSKEAWYSYNYSYSYGYSYGYNYGYSYYSYGYNYNYYPCYRPYYYGGYNYYYYRY
jgi:hypothetical protein